MMKKLMSVAAFGAGYVLGARAGRERYDQMTRGFRRIHEDPRVQEQAHRVAEVAREHAPVAMAKVGDVASSAVAKVRPSSESPEPDESAAATEEGAAPQDPFPTSLP